HTRDHNPTNHRESRDCWRRNGITQSAAVPPGDGQVHKRAPSHTIFPSLRLTHTLSPYFSLARSLRLSLSLSPVSSRSLARSRPPSLSLPLSLSLRLSLSLPHLFCAIFAFPSH